MATSNRERERELRAQGDPSTADRPAKRGLKRISPQSRWYWARLVLENPVAVASIGFILLILLATATMALWSDQDPTRLNPADRLQSPSGDFWLGTDQLGRDVLLRAVWGVRISLLIGFSIMFLSGAIGTLIGMGAAYYQKIDTPIMRVMDGIMAFPPIVLAIALMASFGQGTQYVIIALTVVYIPVIARLARGSTLSVKNQLYVEAARSIGVKDFPILMRHIFPNIFSPLIVQGTFIVALAIIAEASLSFLGAGVPPDVPTWGSMLQEGQSVIRQAWWLILTPGAFLFVTVLSLNLIGDALRDALDPRSRER
ncbi:MAG: ABC transporter permease [Sphaerobacteraceae bacterium]|nr:MAG: ABC transporter permease [Sphaerobacteraceae bacterium]